MTSEAQDATSSRLRAAEPDESFLLSEDQLRARGGKKWQLYGPDVIPAWVADMDYQSPLVVRTAVADAVTSGDFRYPSTELQPAVHSAFRTWMRSRHDWDPGPGRVMMVADLVQALTASVLAYSAPGDRVATLGPSYPPMRKCITACGRMPDEVALVGAGFRYELDLDALREALAHPRTSILLLCHPHNPTGRVFNDTELEAVAALARKHDVVVISDEVHADIVYPGHRFVPFALRTEGTRNRVVTLQSASKSFNLGGLRCGVIHFGTDDLEKTFHAVHPDRLLGRVGRFGMEATLAAWTVGEPWLSDVLTVLGTNRDHVASWARHHPTISAYRPEATYFAWLDCTALAPAPTSAWEFFRERAGVVPSDGRDFGAGGEAFVRLNFATSPELLDRILARIDAATSHTATTPSDHTDSTRSGDTT